VASTARRHPCKRSNKDTHADSLHKVSCMRQRSLQSPWQAQRIVPLQEPRSGHIKATQVTNVQLSDRRVPAPAQPPRHPQLILIPANCATTGIHHTG
jgi:hypothetical protein